MRALSTSSLTRPTSSGASWQHPEAWDSMSRETCLVLRSSSGPFAPEEHAMPSGRDDPFKPANATVLRPQPGAGKRTPSVSPPAPAPGSLPPRRGAQPPLDAGRADAAGTILPRLLGQGLNPLVTAAVPLLLRAGGMRGSSIQGDVLALRRQALEEIRRFEERAR